MVQSEHTGSKVGWRTRLSASVSKTHTAQQWNTELQLVGFGAVSRTASNIIWWLNIYNVVCSFYLHSIITDLKKMPVQLHIILIFRGIMLSLSVRMKTQGSSTPCILQYTILYLLWQNRNDIYFIRWLSQYWYFSLL